MSVKIYALAEHLGMEGQKFLELLKERGFVTADTRSINSVLNRIYEEEICREFQVEPTAIKKKKNKPVETPVPALSEPLALPFFMKRKKPSHRTRMIGQGWHGPHKIRHNPYPEPMYHGQGF